jgi:hypothetical protein
MPEHDIRPGDRVRLTPSGTTILTRPLSPRAAKELEQPNPKEETMSSTVTAKAVTDLDELRTHDRETATLRQKRTEMEAELEMLEAQRLAALQAAEDAYASGSFPDDEVERNDQRQREVRRHLGLIDAGLRRRAKDRAEIIARARARHEREDLLPRLVAAAEAQLARFRALEEGEREVDALLEEQAGIWAGASLYRPGRSVKMTDAVRSWAEGLEAFIRKHGTGGGE